MRRGPVIAVLSSLAAVLAACGGSSSGTAPVSTATTTATTATTVAPTSTAAPTSVLQTTTTVAPTTTDGIELDKLSGRLLMQAVGCGSQPDATDQAKWAGVDNVDEAMEVIRGMKNVSTNIEICVMNIDGSGLVRVSPPDVEAESPGWIEGGERIVFRMQHQWFVVNPDGTNLQPWTDPTNLVWRASPDGTQYVNKSLHDTHVYLTPVGQKRKGPGRRPVLNDVFGDTFVWSPDGQFLLFNKGPGACPSLWKIDVATLEQTAITGPDSPSAGNGFCALTDTHTWSPDGSTILVQDYEGIQPDSHPYLVDPDGSNLRPLVTENFFDDPEWFSSDVVWSPDSKYVFIDVISTEAFLKQAPTRLVVRVADGLVKSVPWKATTVMIDLMWAPTAPELAPGPDEDVDAV